MNQMVYQTLDDVDFELEDVPALPRPDRVVLTTPEQFDVQYVINPHMEGQVGRIDTEAAATQWRRLRGAYESLGIDVAEVRAAEDLPDMVFCANQTLPFYDPREGAHGVVLSRMHAEQRRPEVQHYARFFEERGYRIVTLPDDLDSYFEGMGDAIWHPNRFLLWGGYGFRTGIGAYRFISEELDIRVLAVELADPDFYHLDTCFSVLDQHSVLICPDAFDDDALGLIDYFFQTVVEAPDDEARELFACNAHCPDGRHVVIQAGCVETNARLREANFIPVEVDTSEFLKAGGSVFCMKQMVWS